MTWKCATRALLGRRALYDVRTHGKRASEATVENEIYNVRSSEDMSAEHAGAEGLNKSDIRKLIKRIRTLYIARDPEFLETLTLMRELIAEDERQNDLPKAA
jgi:hypothetical protein